MNAVSKPRKKTVAETNGPHKIKFALAAKPDSKVFVTGSFCDWDPEQYRMRYNRRTGKYSVAVSLAPGSYEYKFSVDGEWLIDPECDHWVSNCFDTLNSVLVVE